MFALILTSCTKEEEVVPEREDWEATVHYESTVKKLPVVMTFKCGKVEFEKVFGPRPTDAPFTWDTTFTLHEGDSLYYETNYHPVTCEQIKSTYMAVYLKGYYRQITLVDLGVSGVFWNLILTDRVWDFDANYYSKHPHM